MLTDLYTQQDNEFPVSPLLTEFRALRSQMQRQGLFKCSKGYYIFKLASNFVLLAAAVSIFVLYSGHLWAYCLSAFLIGLFWQQSGWLAHDFLHHQVFKSRRLNHVFGLFVGDVCLVSTAASATAAKNARNLSCSIGALHMCRASVRIGGRASTTPTTQLPMSLSMTANHLWIQT